MSAFLKRLRSRAADKVNRSAAGSAVPAGQDAAAGDRSSPTARERGAMRRRLRELRSMREALLLELGALVFELRKRGRDDSELVAQKAGELEQVEVEAAGLARALDAETTISEVVSTGVAGACPRCGTLASTRAAFCSSCGLELRRAAYDDAAGADADGEPKGTGAGSEPDSGIASAAAEAGRGT